MKLGKKIVPETVVVDDEWEAFTVIHGDKMLRNKRTGAIETNEPTKGDQFPNPWQPLLDAMKKIRGEQEADGLPVEFDGWL